MCYKSPNVHSEYLRSALTPETIHEILNKACLELEPLARSCRLGIAFSGMSGALIAPLVAHTISASLVMVRKSNDDSHSCRVLEGDSGIDKYIIVDDLVATGNTFRRIREQIEKNWRRDFRLWDECPVPEFAGLWLYEEGCGASLRPWYEYDIPESLVLSKRTPVTVNEGDD